MMSEFNLIRDYFTWPAPDQAVRLGVGDDAAILWPAADEELVMSIDTFSADIHFPSTTPAHAIGHKALAVNLSDIAAMGARPRWFTLALCLPEADQLWLKAFARGLRELAEHYAVQLIGGDTTRGALSITIQVTGTNPKGLSLRRSGAKTGDLICVSGTLGDAAAGLDCIRNQLRLPDAHSRALIHKLNYPAPQVRLGQALRTDAHSGMDLSDGLLSDLGHILRASDKGAEIKHNQIPLSPILQSLPTEQRMAYALTGGDDYELLFTLAPDKLAKIEQAANQQGQFISVIGHITDRPGQLDLDYPLANQLKGYSHFAG